MTVMKITLTFITYAKRPIYVGDYLNDNPFFKQKSTSGIKGQTIQSGVSIKQLH